MLSPTHEALAELFFRLIADHGRFHERQLIRFVELKTGAKLTREEEDSCLSHALRKGAEREKGIAPVYAFPARKRLAHKTQTLPGQLAFNWSDAARKEP